MIAQEKIDAATGRPDQEKLDIMLEIMTSPIDGGGYDDCRIYGDVVIIAPVNRDRPGRGGGIDIYRCSDLVDLYDRLVFEVADVQAESPGCDYYLRDAYYDGDVEHPIDVSKVTPVE